MIKINCWTQDQVSWSDIIDQESKTWVYSVDVLGSSLKNPSDPAVVTV